MTMILKRILEFEFRSQTKLLNFDPPESQTRHPGLQEAILKFRDSEKSLGYPRDISELLDVFT